MKRMKITAYVLGLLTAGFTLQSCDNDDDDNWELRRPTALVTVRPQADGKFTLQLDNNTTLFPSNMDKSPYGDKEVRACELHQGVHRGRFVDGRQDSLCTRQLD